MSTAREGSRDGSPRRRMDRPGRGGGSTATAESLAGRERPTNADAERAVLGSILLKPDVCDDVALVVRPEDFFDEAHQLLYRHLLELHDGGKRIDATILLERLRTQGDLERIGGPPLLADVLEAVPHAAHATHYAQIVRDKALLRNLIDAGTDILREAYEAADEPRQLLSRAEERIFSILERRSSADAQPIAAVLEDVMVRMDARMKHEHAIGGVETGFSDLDTLCGGLHN
ncbi:MAG: DnaB-like helicase N-terminal domain-containing protein, partial [Planctomycetota bacterium]